MRDYIKIESSLEGGGFKYFNGIEFSCPDLPSDEISDVCRNITPDNSCQTKSVCE